MEDKMVTTVENTPEFDQSIKCPDCKPGDYIIEGYGLLGGGIGPYTMCGNCGLLLSKSQDEAMCESHETTEIKDAEQVADDKAERPTEPSGHAADDDKQL